MKKKRLNKSTFDNMYLELMTRCIAEMMLAKEMHPMFKYSLN